MPEGSIYHIKGIPLDKRPEYLAKGHVSFFSPVTIREALWRGDIAGRWTVRSRSRANVVPKREICPDDPQQPGCALTRPWDLQDLRSPEIQRLFCPGPPD
jgi:hypothetical protein